jgi:hypothetical protein
MSDTTVVIAGFRFGADLQYTAAVVQAAENLEDGSEDAIRKARRIFFETRREWFSSLGRAKQFANLLAADLRENSSLEHEDIPIYEIEEDRVHRLSRKGNRLS